MNILLRSSLLFLLLVHSVNAQNSAAFSFNLPSQPLSSTLNSLADVTGTKLIYADEMTQGKLAPPLQGDFTLAQALNRVLNDNKLSYELVDNSMIAIKPNHPEPIGLPEITISGKLESDSPYNTDYTRSNTSTATRTNTPVMETPFSVQIVPQQVLKDQQVTRLETAVQNISGVLQAPTNQGGSDGFMIRGFLSNNVYRNGVQMPDLLFGGTTKREMANIERVEVLKGPGSILFGRTDPGGILNTVTKQPLATPYYSLQQQAGNFDFYRTTADATGPLTKDGALLYRLNLSYENSGSFRDFVDKESVFVAPVLRWNISPQTQVTAELEYQHFKEVADPGIPPIGNRPANVPRDRFVGEPINDRNPPGDRYFIGVNWSHAFNDSWTVNHRLSAKLLDFSSNSLFFSAANPDGSLQRFFNNAPSNNSNRYQSSLNLVGNITTGILEHTILIGYDFFHFDDKISAKGRFCCPEAPAFNIFSPTFLNARPVLDAANNGGLSIGQSWHGAYFQDQIKLPYNIHVLGGFRYDNAVARNRRLGLTTASDDRFSPRGGLLWQPMRWLSLYGSYTENFGPSNSIFSEDGQALPPQTAQQWETGLKTEFFEGRLRSTFSYFDLTRQNIAVADPNNPRFSLAIGEAETRGIELDISGEILPGWSVIAAYTHMPFAKVTKDVGSSGLPGDTGTQGNRLFLAPKHFGNLWSTYEFQNELLRGLRIGAGVTGVGDRQGNAENTFQIPYYVIGNLMASYAMKMGKTLVTAQLNVNNVSDEKYFAGTNTGNFIAFGAPRTFLGSLRIEY